MSVRPRLRIPAGSVARLMLAAQGIDRAPRRRATKADVLEVIRRMGALQIDTINVVARSPYLVLWSRLGAYDPEWLDELLAEGRLFEYWAHEACFVPAESYPLFRHRMIDPGSLGWKYSHEWIEKNAAVVDRVLRAIREKGPVRSADFERTDGRPGGGWWGWKPEKRALELLFTAGELMVARRERFQRVYDLRERVLPAWRDEMLRPAEEADLELARKSIAALGVARPGWVADYFRMPKPAAAAAVARLLANGEVRQVDVETWSEPALVLEEHLERVESAQSARRAPSHTTILSPFDPLIWDRARTRSVFSFDYRLECYVPEAKRVHGYFVLPVLRRGRIVGRLDAKAHRRDGVMEVKTLRLEDGVRPGALLLADLAGALRRFAAWHATPAVRIRRTEPATIARDLRRALAAAESGP